MAIRKQPKEFADLKEIGQQIRFLSATAGLSLTDLALILDVGADEARKVTLTDLCAFVHLTNGGTPGTAAALKAMVLNADAAITSGLKTLTFDKITSGTADNIKVGAFASTADGSGSVLSTTRTGCVRVYCDDGGVALGAAGSVPDLRAILARVLVTEDASANNIRLFPVMGHLKAYAATGDVGVWNNEQVGGVHGYVELVRASGTATYGGYGITAGLMATLENSGVVTIDTNHVLAGVAAISKLTADMVQTGRVAGLYVGKYDATNWSDGTARANWGYGLLIDEDAVSVCPIQVGEFVSSAGTGGGFAVTLTNSAACRVYAEVTADLTSSAMVRSILGRMLISGNFTSTAECFGTVGQLVIKQAKVQHDNAGVLGSLEVQTTAATFSGDISDTCSAAVLGRVGVTITGTTVEADGILAGVAAMSNITSGYVTVTAGGVLAGFYAGAFSSKQVWDYGLYIPASAVTCDIRLQSGSTIQDANHLDIETYDDTKRIRLNDRNYAATTGDIIGFSAKPAANASGTQTVYGGQISPRFNDNVDGAALVGLMVEPILKGATVLALSGDMRAVDARLTSEGANTVGGIAGCLFCFNELPASTYTGGVYPIVVKAAGKTQAWTALMEVPTGVTNAANGSGTDVYLNITINGTAARIAAKYVS